MVLLIDNFIENSNKYNLKLKKLKTKKEKLKKFFKYWNIDYYFTNNINILINIIYALLIKLDEYSIQLLIDFKNSIKDTIDILIELEEGNSSFPKGFNDKEISLYKNFFDLIDDLNSINYNCRTYYIEDNKYNILNICKILNDNIIQKINKVKIKKELESFVNDFDFKDKKNLIYKEKKNFEDINTKIMEISSFLQNNDINDIGNFWIKEIKKIQK